MRNSTSPGRYLLFSRGLPRKPYVVWALDSFNSLFWAGVKLIAVARARVANMGDTSSLVQGADDDRSGNGKRRRCFRGGRVPSSDTVAGPQETLLCRRACAIASGKSAGRCKCPRISSSQTLSFMKVLQRGPPGLVTLFLPIDMPRTARIQRETGETRVDLAVELDGVGR